MVVCNSNSRKNGSQIFSSVLVGVEFLCVFLKINQLLFEISGSLSSDLPAEGSRRHPALFTSSAAASPRISSLTARLLLLGPLLSQESLEGDSEVDGGITSLLISFQRHKQG